METFEPLPHLKDVFTPGRSMEYRVRFAPSPTGSPHVGNIRSAILNWLFARHYNGSFILRIEDTDRERYTEEGVKAILDGLKWIGLYWDEGPELGGPFGPYIQSERLEIYQRCAQYLVERGYAYYCTCTKERLEEVRKEQMAKGIPPRYDRHCRDLGIKGSPGDPDKVIRFKIPYTGNTKFNDIIRGEISFSNALLDDFVILKSDGYPTYHLANIVDDHLMKITYVMRAEEWIPSTGKHILLYNAFGWKPPKFAHLSVILGPDKSKLSKRHGASSIIEFREMGYLPDALFNYLSLIGWSPKENREIFSRDELIQMFDLSGLNPSSGVFDINKLKWMNGEYIRMMKVDELVEVSMPFLKKRSWDRFPHEYLIKVYTLMQERLKLITDIYELGYYFFEDPHVYDENGKIRYFTPET
ncbi:MAG: glutamate--tRNA ligase, partial [bacterium]